MAVYRAEALCTPSSQIHEMSTRGTEIREAQKSAEVLQLSCTKKVLKNKTFVSSIKTKRKHKEQTT